MTKKEISRILKKYGMTPEQAVDHGIMCALELCSKDVQMAAIQQNGHVIQHTVNPSEIMKMIAVRCHDIAVQYIKNPSEAVKMIAVQQNGRAVQYIKNPSEAVQMAAVRKNGDIIEYIKNPSKDVLIRILDGVILNNVHNS